MIKVFLLFFCGIAAFSAVALDALVIPSSLTKEKREAMVRQALDRTPEMTVRILPAPVFYPDPDGGPATESMSEAEKLIHAGRKAPGADQPVYGDPSQAKFLFYAEKADFYFRMETPADSRISAVVECLAPISFTMKFGSAPGSLSISLPDGIALQPTRTCSSRDVAENGMRMASAGLLARGQFFYRGIEAILPGFRTVWTFRVTFRTPEKEAEWKGDVVFPPRTKKNILDAQALAKTEMATQYYPPKVDDNHRPGDDVYKLYDMTYNEMKFFRDRFGMPNRLAFAREFSMRYLCDQVPMEQIIREVADSVAESRTFSQNFVLMNHYLTGSGAFDAVARPEKYRERRRLEAIRNHVFSPDFTKE